MSLIFRDFINSSTTDKVITGITIASFFLTGLYIQNKNIESAFWYSLGETALLCGLLVILYDIKAMYSKEYRFKSIIMITSVLSIGTLYLTYDIVKGGIYEWTTVLALISWIGILRLLYRVII
jgi:hypothetical protein